MIDSFEGENRYLSNFWFAPVVFEGMRFASVEHAFQAAKTTDPVERIRFQKPGLTPSKAKSMGKVLRLRQDWEDVKYEIMVALVKDKFTRTPELGQQLLATGTQTLIEGNLWHDQTWGDCRCWTQDTPKFGRKDSCKEPGQNKLGKILVDVRSSLEVEALYAALQQ